MADRAHALVVEKAEMTAITSIPQPVCEPVATRPAWHGAACGRRNIEGTSINEVPGDGRDTDSIR